MYNRMKIFRKLQCKGRLPRRRGKGQSLIFHDKSDQPPEAASMTVAKVVAKMKLRSKNETTINTIYHDSLQEIKQQSCLYYPLKVVLVYIGRGEKGLKISLNGERIVRKV